MIKNRGFTLVELLISIAIIITSATIVVMIITASYRSSNKTNTIDLVRQAGNLSLTQLTKMIQFADDFQSATDDSGDEVAFCPVDDGASAIDFKTIEIVSGGSVKSISCNDNGSLSLNDRPLIDDNEYYMNGCRLTCSQKKYSESPIIGVSFKLYKEGYQAESGAGVSFTQKIKMRNLNQ